MSLQITGVKFIGLSPTAGFANKAIDVRAQILQLCPADSKVDIRISRSDGEYEISVQIETKTINFELKEAGWRFDMVLMNAKWKACDYLMQAMKKGQ